LARCGDGDGAQAATGGRGWVVATEGRCKRPESCEGEGRDGGRGDGDVLDTRQGGQTATGPSARERTVAGSRGGGRGRGHGRAAHMSSGGRRDGRAAEVAEGAAAAAGRAPGPGEVGGALRACGGSGGGALEETDEQARLISERRRQHSGVWRRRGDRAGAASYTAARRGKALADMMGETSCLRTVAELAPRGAMAGAAVAA
jgi:hypothetical protein